MWTQVCPFTIKVYAAAATRVVAVTTLPTFSASRRIEQFGSAVSPPLSSYRYCEPRHRCKKRFFTFFLFFWSRFTFLKVFFIFQTFFYLKKRSQSSERQAD